jgi:hypothetical protein
VTGSLLPEYALLLDAIAPRAVARGDHRKWDSGRWEQTVRVADWHRLSPMLFCHLESDGHVPAAVLSTLEQAYLANAARNLFLSAAQRHVVDALVAADVPALLLKGAALVETVYSDPAQREMLDLDLLVPADRLDTANAAVTALGYRSPGQPFDEGARRHVRVGDHHDPALIDEKQVVAVELHRHVAISGEGTGFDIDEVWQRARAAPSGAHLLPSPEDLLLHVCFHFTRNRLGGSYRRRHTGGALAQICDIARIVERETIDWETLLAAARRYRLDAAVFLALFAARELGVPVSDSALAELRPQGFDHRLGSRLVSLRVLRTGDHLPVRSARWMLLPSREVLARGWDADPTATLSLVRAYARRARANAPLARAALRRPWSVVQDHRLNGQIHALQTHE